MALSTGGDAGIGQSGLSRRSWRAKADLGPGTPIPATPKSFGAGAPALVRPNKAPRQQIVPRSCEVLFIKPARSPSLPKPHFSEISNLESEIARSASFQPNSLIYPMRVRPFSHGVN
jgi:hypothetical protein